jgi:hypothetical protein
LILVLGSGCGDRLTLPISPSQQGARVDVTLHPGQETIVPGTILRLGFTQVVQDSRCPIDVQCIWQGEAVLELALGIGMGPSRPDTVSTLPPKNVTRLFGYRVTLVDVQPAPLSTRQIPPGEYAAHFLVEAVEEP